MLDINSTHDVVFSIKSMHTKGLRITVYHIHKYMNDNHTEESHKSYFEAISIIDNEIKLNNIEEINIMDIISPKGLCLEYYKMKYYRDPIIAKLHKSFMVKDWDEGFQKLAINTENSIDFAKHLLS